MDQKTMRPADAMVSSGVLMLLGVAIALYATEFELGSLDMPGAGFMPFLAGVLIFAASAPQFIDALKARTRGGESVWGGNHLIHHAVVLATVFAYGALLESIGFVVCSFLLVLVSMRVNGGEAWRSSLLWAAFIAALGYLIFVIGLSVDLPRGVFPL